MTNIPSFNEILPFGILDLCKRNESQTTAEAIYELINLAKFADKWGYTRYWIAEHHVPDSASCAPELLLSLLAVNTKRIRIGTGGTIMGYYSPYKVAEIANSLQTLSTGRFDLGLCRGPGVIDKAVAEELVSGNVWELEQGVFERKVAKTTSLIRGIDTTSQRLKIHASSETKPQVWLLGSSGHTATLANTLDMSLALALFITRDEEITLTNSKCFQPGLDRKSILAVSVVCAETDDKAITKHKKLLDGGSMPSNFIGSYSNVVEKLINLLGHFSMNELLVVLLSRDANERTRTYYRLAESYRQTKTKI